MMMRFLLLNEVRCHDDKNKEEHKITIKKKYKYDEKKVTKTMMNNNVKTMYSSGKPIVLRIVTNEIRPRLFQFYKCFAISCISCNICSLKLLV